MIVAKNSQGISQLSLNCCGCTVVCESSKHKLSILLVEHWLGRSTTIKNDKELEVCGYSRVFWIYVHHSLQSNLNSQQNTIFFLRPINNRISHGIDKLNKNKLSPCYLPLKLDLDPIFLSRGSLFQTMVMPGTDYFGETTVQNAITYLSTPCENERTLSRHC